MRVFALLELTPPTVFNGSSPNFVSMFLSTIGRISINQIFNLGPQKFSKKFRSLIFMVSRVVCKESHHVSVFLSCIQFVSEHTHARAYLDLSKTRARAYPGRSNTHTRAIPMPEQYSCRSNTHSRATPCRSNTHAGAYYYQCWDIPMPDHTQTGAVSMSEPTHHMSEHTHTHTIASKI